MSTWDEVEYRWEKPVPAFTQSRGKGRRLLGEAYILLGEADENIDSGFARDAISLARQAISMALMLDKREGE